MFGTHFYNRRVSKSVAIFGALFNELYVVRKGAQQSYNQMRVPLQYAPRRKFIERIEQMIDGEDAERQLATKLPRMSFEIVNIQYDPTRQLPKLNTVKRCVPGENDRMAKIYTGTPYIISFQLSIYAKTHDDALQVVEQIVPYFNPQYTVAVKPIDGIDDLTEDVPILINGVSFTDDYEGLMEQRRTIIYTLDFDMKINFYGPNRGDEDYEKIIKRVDVEMYDLETSIRGVGDSADDGYIQTVRTEVDPFSAGPDSDWTVTWTVFDKLDST